MPRSPIPRFPRGALSIALPLLAACLVALAAPGCDGDPVGPPTGIHGDPDDLMAAFDTSYARMNRTAYDRLLAADFRFVPLPEDREDLGLTGSEVVGRDQELAIAARMFSGEPGPGGDPGLTGIDIVRLNRTTAWHDTLDPLFPGSQEALFEVEIHFVHADGYFRVSGRQRFWARSLPDGGDGVRWHLAGQEDLTTVVKVVEDASWGRVKTLYQ